MAIFSPSQLSTQDHLDIEEIRDDMVVLRDGTVAVVLETSALNFELLSSQEQDANIYGFANLMNSISFPIQIVIRTVSTDISNYLNRLNEYQSKSANQSLKAQVDIYKDFIANLTETTNILDKTFYVVVPIISVNPQQTSVVRKLFGQRQRLANIDKLLENAKLQLQPKRDHMIKQFGSIGIDIWQLKNDGLIKLYYSIYDPDRHGMNKISFSEEDIRQDLVEVS